MTNRKNRACVFGVIFMAATVFFASCANDSSNAAVPSDVADSVIISENAAIGSVVSIDDAEFYIIKNTYLQNRNSSRAAVSENVDDVSNSIDDEDAKSFVKKFAGAEYIDTYLSQEANITEYILLYNRNDVKTVKKETSAKNIANLEDRFPVYQYVADKNSYIKIAELSQAWTSEFLIGNYLDTSKKTEKDRAEVFNAMTEAQIRSYDPDQIKISTNSNLYGTNLSKKISITIAYNRDNKGNLNFDDVHYHKQYLKYQLVDGKETWSYFYQKNPNVEPVSTMYNLGGRYQLYKYEYAKEPTSSKKNFIINAQGDGEINGSSDPALYKNSIQFYANSIKAQIGNNTTSPNYKVVKVNYNGFDLNQRVNVTIETQGKSEQITKEDKSQYTFKEAIMTFLSDYVKIAETEIKNNSEYLKKLYTKASFADGAYFNKDFIIVSATVDEHNELIPDYESVINKFADNNILIFTGKYTKTDTFPE
ncbi:MAG: hypothetical protein HDR39_00580 [Treponema sp.]|nr:hypothetical protein [Treponema sp.]